MATKSLLLRSVILMVITVFFGNYVIADGTAQTGSGAKIEVANDTADFGDVKPKSTHSYVYRFKNVGVGNLVISRIQSTCGCAVPELAKKEYAPGESGEIKVAYTAATREGESVKHLYIHSNDSTNPRFPLIVKSVTVLKAAIEPQKLDLSIAKENAGFPELRVYSRDGQPFAIKDIVVNGNPFKFEFDPQKKVTEHIIKPVVDNDKLKQFLSGVINVKIDHPECDSLTVTYNALPEYSASPARIILQNATPGEKQVREIWIKNNYGNSIEIGAVKSQKGFMNYEVVENKDGMAKLNITITVPAKVGDNRYFSDDLAVTVAGSEDIIIKCSGWYTK